MNRFVFAGFLAVLVICRRSPAASAGDGGFSCPKAWARVGNAALEYRPIPLAPGAHERILLSEVMPGTPLVLNFTGRHVSLTDGSRRFDGGMFGHNLADIVHETNLIDSGLLAVFQNVDSATLQRVHSALKPAYSMSCIRGACHVLGKAGFKFEGGIAPQSLSEFLTTLVEKKLTDPHGNPVSFEFYHVNKPTVPIERMLAVQAKFDQMMETRVGVLRSYEKNKTKIKTSVVVVTSIGASVLAVYLMVQP